MRKTIFNLFSITIIFVLFSLGTWQLYRLQWKENIIHKIEVFSKLPPISFDINSIEEFKKIKINGKLLEKNYFLYQLNEKGNYGFNLISVLQTDNSNFFLVKRGWLPKIEKKYEENYLSETANNVEIEGTLYLAKPKRNFVPENSNKEKFYYYLDIGQLSKSLNVQLEPYLIEQSSPDKYFVNLKNTSRINITNNHLQYAITWYVLGFCILIAFWFLKKRYK